MPSFTTASPIDLAINLPAGWIEVIASDRTDTVVTVSPTDSAKENDRHGADQTNVDFDGHRLTVTGPRPRFSWIGPSESVELRVELPTRSRLTAEIGVGSVRTFGRLGATRIKSSTGAVDLDTTGDLWLQASHGTTTVGTAEGSVEITADHGQIRIDTVSGDAILKTSYGGIVVGESGGDLDAKLSYGDLEVTQALGSVTTRTAYGSIQLCEVSTGSIQAESAYGRITIGVRPGVPAWLDLSSKHGHVRNELDSDRAPDPSEPAVAVRARTQGDITIQRAR